MTKFWSFIRLLAIRKMKSIRNFSIDICELEIRETLPMWCTDTVIFIGRMFRELIWQIEKNNNSMWMLIHPSLMVWLASRRGWGSSAVGTRNWHILRIRWFLLQWLEMFLVTSLSEFRYFPWTDHSKHIVLVPFAVPGSSLFSKASLLRMSHELLWRRW